MTERRLRRMLEEARAPDAPGAEERAWGLVRAAWRAEQPAPARVWGAKRRGIQAAIAVALAAATISPAGASVRNWVGDVVRTGATESKPALTSLPTAGSLLVDSPRGPWLVRRDGSKRLLGPYVQSTWSPHGLFVAATTRHQLLALDPQGTVRWSLAHPGPIRDPAWSPDGYRIAYLSGDRLRVVAGDGSGDRVLATGVSGVAPAWAPGARHPLSFLDAGRIRTMQVDDGKTLSRPVAPGGTLSLGWSANGAQLLVVARRELQLRDRGGRLLWRRRAPDGMRFVSAALAPGARGPGLPTEIAAALAGRSGSSELLLFPTAGDWQQRLFAGLGRLDEVFFSPDGRWLLFAWRNADQWLFVEPAGPTRPSRVVAISGISSQFDPGATSPPAFPSIAGWCCRALGGS